MKVITTCTLKNSSVGTVPAGTIFEGAEKTLPEFVLSELKKNRGTIEILSRAEPKKKRAVRKTNVKLDADTNTKPATLREKLAKVEE